MCKKAFNKRNNASVNLCLLHKEQYQYPYIQKSMGEKNFYYHLDMSCVRALHPTFQPWNMSIQESLKENIKKVTGSY